MTDANTKACDACVIGAGPGGYVAAIRLAQLGLSTILVEREALGGVCLNWGCIPSKALIHAGKLFEHIKKAGEYGIAIPGEPTIDLATLVKWKDEVVGRLTGGIAQLMKANKVEVVSGEGLLEGPRTVAVGATKIRVAKGIILATGSRSIEIPNFAYDGREVHDNRSILALKKIPKRLVVIGGGVIGLEMGQFFAKIGTELSVVEMTPTLLPGVDPDLVKVVERTLKKAKAKLYLSTKAAGLERKDGGVVVLIETPAGKESIPADGVLVSVGRRPNSEKLGLDKVGVAVDKRGFVQVNDRLETNVAGIHAIGDLVGGPLLAHKASKEGIVAAEAIAGKKTRYDVRAMPAAIFTDPEIATVGLSDAEAKAAGFATKIGQFPFSALGRSQASGEMAGFVKLVSDAKTGVLLGAGIVGPGASDLIAECALAIELGATAEDLALTVHAHPTFAEGVMEAAEDVLGHAIHVPPKRA